VKWSDTRGRKKNRPWKRARNNSFYHLQIMEYYLSRINRKSQKANTKKQSSFEALNFEFGFSLSFGICLLFFLPNITRTLVLRYYVFPKTLLGKKAKGKNK